MAFTWRRTNQAALSETLNALHLDDTVGFIFVGGFCFILSLTMTSGCHHLGLEEQLAPITSQQLDEIYHDERAMHNVELHK